MGNYVQHLRQLSTSKTFERKKDYVNHNLKNFFIRIRVRDIKILEVGPGLGEFESYLNDKKVFDIDIIDNDKSILEYVSKKYKIREKYLT